ncbi:MAG: DUF86 domain-containing protein [Nitrospinae bacterium]|nr:DUF86 domain-containing protein [Nitrospinota bacterium]MBF0635529.1 DUF86 domain-containing protein [Nitrospinota bacterium]
MLKNDEIRLLHMLDAAREAVSLSADKTLDDLKHDRVLTLALLKLIEIMGEASVKISDEFKAGHETIPWRAVTAMRNHLIHVYFNVDLNIVWGAVKDEMPRLITSLEKIIKNPEK